MTTAAKTPSEATKRKYKDIIVHAIFTLNERKGSSTQAIWKFIQTKHQDTVRSRKVFYTNLKRAADEATYVYQEDKKIQRFRLTKTMRELLRKKAAKGETDLNLKKMHDMLKPTKPKANKPTKTKTLKKNAKNKTKKGKETRKKANDKKADAKMSKRTKKAKQDAKAKKTKETGKVDSKKILNEKKKKANEKGSKANKKSVNQKKQKVENKKKSIKSKNETKSKRASSVSAKT